MNAGGDQFQIRLNGLYENVGKRSVVEEASHRSFGGDILALHAKRQGGMRLRIKVDQENALSFHRQSNSKVYRRGRLGDPAFLVNDSNGQHSKATGKGEEREIVMWAIIGRPMKPVKVRVSGKKSGARRKFRCASSDVR